MSVSSIIGRGTEGTLVMGLVKCLLASSPLMAEAFALREAIVLAANMGVQQVIFESDWQELVQTCNHEIQWGET